MNSDYSKYPTKPKDEIIIAMPSNEVWIIPILKYFDGIKYIDNLLYKMIKWVLKISWQIDNICFIILLY